MGERDEARVPLLAGQTLLGSRVTVTGADQQPVLARTAPAKQRIVTIDEDGAATYTSLRKHYLVSELQLRHRDIRQLEPGVALPYPAAVFVRRGAFVLNFEGLKAVISRDRMLLMSAPLPHELSARAPPDLGSPVVARLAGHIASRAVGAAAAGYPSDTDELRYRAELPFELRALEAALLVVVTALDAEVRALEGAAAPALARLRRAVGRADLELIFDTQNRLNKAVSRVERVKEVLEELLDDRDEMEAMCLTARDDARKAAEAAASALAAAASATDLGGGSPLRRAASLGALDEDGPFGTSLSLRSAAGKAAADAAKAAADDDDDDSDLAELEDLIEAHWLQSDSLLSRLRILQERISNTEHLVNLDLDSKRNALVALGLFVDVALMAAEIHMLCTSIFGMNLTSGLEAWQPWSLWGIVAFGLVVGTTCSVLVLRYAKRRGLLFLPSFGLGPPPAVPAAP